MPINPLVSLCIPTRNRANLLRQALPTILGQDYNPIEILISDNNSDDDTEVVGRDVARGDPRVRYIRHTRNIGLYGNHNFCLDESRGEFVCLWHDDDVHDTSQIRRYVALMRQHARVGMVCSDCDLIDGDGRIIGARNRSVETVTSGLEYIGQTFVSGQSSVMCPGAMIRRSALGDAHFEENGPIGFADFTLWFRIAENADVGHIGERLWQYRLHGLSLSRRKIWQIARDYEYHLGGYCTSHLVRWPQHRDLVAGWRVSLERFLFWALAYEIALNSRHVSVAPSSSRYRTVFEIADYSLDASELRDVLTLMRRYRGGLLERTAALALTLMIRARWTRPLGWAMLHVESLRRILGLR